MRLKSDKETYLCFEPSPSRKVVREYRARYEGISDLLDQHPEFLERIHEDLEDLSESREGRAGVYTTENVQRALIVHQLEQTPWRETVVRISESPFLRSFVRLGPEQEVMDFSFLCKCFKAIGPAAWKAMSAGLGARAVEEGKLDVEQIRVDSPVIEANIHYPTDISLLWDSYRVLVRLLRRVRELDPQLCPHRFHDRKLRSDFLYVQRYQASRSKPRRRAAKRRFRRVWDQVTRVGEIAERICAKAQGSWELELRGWVAELNHYLPLVKPVCDTAERASLKGEHVAASERIYSLFEEHTELIQRGQRRKPVEFGHQFWLAQCPEKFITDYEVMAQHCRDNELLPEITERHQMLFGEPPVVLAADSGFRSAEEHMDEIEEAVALVAIPPCHPRWDQNPVPELWRHFRAGIEGSISGLKRAFRLAVCVYRSFKSFEAAIGMAVFCHNLITLLPEKAPG